MQNELETPEVKWKYRGPWFFKNNKGVAAQLTNKAVVIALAFLISTPFVPFYQITEGHYMEGEGIDILELTNKNASFTLTDVMTEDGFLLKPALNTTEGDRSNVNDVFAYTVESGDTLSSVAQRFGLNKETIMWENNLWNANRLRVGMTLKILPVDGVSHMTKKGDTIDTLAKKYKIDTEALIRQNQLENQAIAIDTLLIIPGAKKTMPKPTYIAKSAPGSIPANFSGSAKGRLLVPAQGRITQGFHGRHYAVDIANKSKGPVYAAASAKVKEAEYGWNGGYGNMVLLDHGDGMQTLYGHCDKLYVSAGQYVETGQTVCWMGSTGRSTGPHVHFEVRINGVKYNPTHFF